MRDQRLEAEFVINPAEQEELYKAFADDPNTGATKLFEILQRRGAILTELEYRADGSARALVYIYRLDS